MGKLLCGLGFGAMALTAVFSAAANAQSPSQTVSAKFYTESQDGKRTGCNIVFEAVYLDQVYRQGKPTVVDGSLSFVSWPAKIPAITLKIVLTDANDEGQTVASTSRPATVSLVQSNGETNVASVLSTFPGETPGSTLAAFKLDDAATDILKRIVSKHELAISFNREKGGIDNSLLIDLDAPSGDARDSSAPSTTVQDFAQCTLGLTDQIEQKLQGH